MSFVCRSVARPGGSRLKNTGEIAYVISDFGYTVRRWQPGHDPEDPGAPGSFQTVCTMAPVLGDITRGIPLAPGEATPVILVEAVGINASRVKDLLARPDSLHLEPAYYELENAEGLNFDFLEEVTRSRTARIVIDFGNGEAEEHRIATNVERTPGGGYAGITLESALGDLLGIPFETVTEAGVVKIQKIRNVASYGDPQCNPTAVPPPAWGRWIVVLEREAPLSTEENDDPLSAAVRAGETALLFFVTDDDGDCLPSTSEQQYGTEDTAVEDQSTQDSDGDGLTDYEEVAGEEFTVEEDDPLTPEDETLTIRCGWTVTVYGREPYPVSSDPRNPDQDGDGVSDYEEKHNEDINGALAPTDPTLADTDRDGLDDLSDPHPLVPAGVLRVKPGASGNGGSWDNAIDLQGALAAARTASSTQDANDDVAEIWVAYGAYLPDADDRTVSFELVPGVGLYGGFAGLETTRSGRNPDPLANATILSGDLGNDGNPANNSYHVIRAEDLDGTAVLDGFTIADGNAVGDGEGIGGGLLVTSGTLSLRNLFFRENQAALGGGLGLESEVPLEISDSVFFGNYASSRGGGISTDINMAMRLAVRGCEFTNNAAYRGGAISYEATAGQLLVDSCVFQWNRTRSDGAGGAMYLFTELAPANATIKSSRFYLNSADVMGGAVLSYIRLQILQSVFWRNSAVHGGAISRVDGELWILNSTFARNEAELFGSDLNVQSSKHVNVKNSIFWENFSGEGERFQFEPSFHFTSIGSTVVYILNTHVQNIGNHRKLSELWFPFMLSDEDPEMEDAWGCDFRLQSTSPCIDAGMSYIDTDPLNPATYVPLPQADLAGNWRLVDGNGDGIPQVDIGAFEYQGE